MTVSGIRPLEHSPGRFITAAAQLPENPRGRTVLKFDLGEGHTSIHASSPSATADWLEHIAAQLRAADQQRTSTVHHITKAA